MMNLLIHAASYERLQAELAAFRDRVAIYTISDDQRICRAGEAEPAEVEPQLFWFNADVYVSGLIEPYFKLVLGSRRVTWMQSMSAGYESPQFRKLLEAGARLTRSNAQAGPIAEYVVSHALSLLHPITLQRAHQAEKRWRMVPFREIGDTTWLIIGFGNIGQGVARRVRPFGSRIIAVKRKSGDGTLADRQVPQDQLLEVLPEADVVVLSCGLNSATRDMADGAFFEAMKPGSILINIARGALVDEDALRQGLDAGKPGFAVLDVFRTEPLPETHWAWDHPQVRVTAHGSHFGDGTFARGDRLFLDNLERFLTGQPLLHEVRLEDMG